jgi:hypothetical protein
MVAGLRRLSAPARTVAAAHPVTAHGHNAGGQAQGEDRSQDKDGCASHLGPPFEVVFGPLTVQPICQLRKKRGIYTLKATNSISYGQTFPAFFPASTGPGVNYLCTRARGRGIFSRKG